MLHKSFTIMAIKVHNWSQVIFLIFLYPLPATHCTKHITFPQRCCALVCLCTCADAVVIA